MEQVLHSCMALLNSGLVELTKFTKLLFFKSGTRTVSIVLQVTAVTVMNLQIISGVMKH